MTEHASVSLGGADGTAHAANMQKRAEGRGDDRQTETADPAAALRDGCNATVDGGQGGMLKAFKAFCRRCNVDGNKIKFEPFCTGLGLMNIRLAPPNMKVRSTRLSVPVATTSPLDTTRPLLAVAVPPRLSDRPPLRAQAFFDSIDTDGAGEIDFSKFAANVSSLNVPIPGIFLTSSVYP